MTFNQHTRASDGPDPNREDEILSRLGWLGRSRVFKTYGGVILGAIAFAWTIALLNGMILYVGAMVALFVIVGRRTVPSRGRLPNAARIDAVSCAIAWLVGSAGASVFLVFDEEFTLLRGGMAVLFSGVCSLALYVAFAHPLFPGIATPRAPKSSGRPL